MKSEAKVAERKDAVKGDGPLGLERYAEISAELDAGAPQPALLEREAIAPELWARSQAHWLKRMAAEVELRRFPVTTKYQAIFKAKRSVAEAKLRATRDARPKPPAPPVGPVEAVAAELAKPIETSLASIDVPAPPRVAPPPRSTPPPAPITLVPAAPTTVVPPAPITAVPPPMIAPPNTVVMPSPIASHVAATPPAPVPRPAVTAPAIIPPAFRPAMAAPPASDDDEGTSRTGIVDVRQLLEKHVMPFQADAKHGAVDDEDDEPPRTGIIDAASLLRAQTMPFQADPAPAQEGLGRPAAARMSEGLARFPESPIRRDADGPAFPRPDAIVRPSDGKTAHGTDRPPPSARHQTAPPPPGPQDLGATLLAPLDPSIRRALPFQSDGAGRSPSSPGMPAIRTPSSSGMPALQQVPTATSPTGGPVPSAPAGSKPPSPTGPGEPRKLTIAAFASLTAELAEHPGDVETIRKKYGVSEADHQEISRTFTHAFRQDEELRQRYVAMVRQYRGYLQAAKR